MSVSFMTNNPQQLLADFKSKIDKKEIVTWRYNAQNGFTHTPDQWNGRAWMQPIVEAGSLRFNFVGSRGYVSTWAIYGVFQGRLIESFVTHCHDLFTTGSATSKPTNTDVVTEKVAA